MPNEKEIWVLGKKNKNADKSFLWKENIPSISDSDVIIIDYSTLTKENLDSIEVKLEEIQTELEDKFIHDGIIILIYSNFLEESTSEKFSSDSVLPLHIFDNSISKGTKLLYNKKHRYADYLKHVKYFDYNITDVNIPEHVFMKIPSHCKLSICPDTAILDNSGRTLGGIYTLTITGESISGDLIILPFPTEISIDEGINKIISINKNELSEKGPSWIESVKIAGLESIVSELETLEINKTKLEQDITRKSIKKNKILRYTSLLFAKDKQLEKIVKEAFKLLGFDEIKQIRNPNDEDWIIELTTIQDIKYGVIEVKGRDKKTLQSDIVQCNKWVDDYLQMKKPIKTKGIFISNQFRLNEFPNSIDSRKRYEPNELEYAFSREICIIPSYVIFEAVNKVLGGQKPDREKIEKVLFETNGILESLL